MRTALIVSAVLHLSLLLAMILNLGQPDAFATQPVAALPIELVTIADETDVTLGETTAEAVVEDAAPETVEAEEPPLPEETPGATDTPADEIATDAAARENAAESSAPQPEAEPEPVAEAETEEPAVTPEPPAEAAPEPEAAAETEVASIAPVESEATPEPEAAEPAPVVPVNVVPNRKPTPPPRRQQARTQPPVEDAFNADRLSQLINRTDPSGGGAGSAQASLGASEGRNAATLTLSEKDALRSQMQRCWNPPIGLADGQSVVVTVQVALGIDGSVLAVFETGRSGTGPLYDVASDAAQRAVIQCQPYRLPAEKHSAWKDVQVNFDPRDLY
ncbi:cell envelope integrity protein TolA [Acuticoccus sp. MNP-M23]|uniref:cell envelope integrity protein TolA n=1 Tax=Acuticoccus sp. MNP-M23 TaxID=3072793 RepID=UPI002816510E|nr:cell envelope integrity protein TolA [Acuticoccus sp. MNP-M23]WMS43861.1 cell envelope integrity protein TolA [Acuticoccus sp. MNP-M23]